MTCHHATCCIACRPRLRIPLADYYGFPVVIWGLEFEWNAAKAEANLQAHGVSFELAKTVFKDPFAIERIDDRQDYGEERFILIGMADGHVLLFIAHTERAGPNSHHLSPEGNTT
jgi:uncharacterized DUF497 family protein